MTEDEFWEYYCKRINLTRDVLIKLGYVAVVCDCGEEFCNGWRMEFSAAILNQQKEDEGNGDAR